MNYRQYFTMILMTTGLTACQSQTEQTPAPHESTSPPAIATKVAPAPDKQALMPASVPSTISSSQTPVTAEYLPVHQPVVTASAHVATPSVTQAATQVVKAPKQKPRLVMAATNKTVAQTVSVDLSVLNKCKICHSLGAKLKVGPGLGKGNGIPGIFGRKAGTFPGFKYKFTKYIKPGKAWVWDEAHLRQWECDSKKAIKAFTGDAEARTKMPPQHLCGPAKQDAAIAALRSIS